MGPVFLIYMVMVKRIILPLLAVAALLSACRSGSDKAAEAVATPDVPGLSNEEVLAGFEAAGQSAEADEDPVAVPETEPLEEE